MQTYILGDDHPDYCLIQAVDEHDLELLDAEYKIIKESCPDRKILLVAFLVDDWNKALSPWEAPAVFGKEGFGNGAKDTLGYVLNELMPTLQKDYSVEMDAVKLVVGGYSLAGLFALWTVYETDLFAACAAASPSVWFPGWIDYVKTNDIRTDTVYLSLGDKEEKAKNQVMAGVGNCIREQADLLSGINSTLEWNNGNHFVDSEKRMGKGFVWCIKAL